MADTVEASGQDVDQEPPDELGRGQALGLHPVTTLDAIVFLSQCHGVGISADQTVVRDRLAVLVSAQIGQHSFGSPEGSLA